MSLKNDIEMVKEELNSEEKFFERAVVTEKFVKKYKNIIISTVVAVVIIAGVNIAYDMHKQNNIIAVNKALSLLETTNDKQALLEIKDISPELYDVWRYSKAVTDKDIATLKELENSKTVMLSDLAYYEEAQNSQDLKALDSYSLKQGSIYKDLALVQSAIILMNDKKIEKAHAKLAMISQDSSLNKIANALLHYGVK